MKNNTLIKDVSFNEVMRQRTKAAALRVIKLIQQLPRNMEAQIIGKQLVCSATSVAANFRAACRGRSSAEWYAKICICVEEVDEALFWLELTGDAEILPKARLAILEQEYLEIVSVSATARKKAKS